MDVSFMTYYAGHRFIYVESSIANEYRIEMYSYDFHRPRLVKFLHSPLNKRSFCAEVIKMCKYYNSHSGGENA